MNITETEEEIVWAWVQHPGANVFLRMIENGQRKFVEELMFIPAGDTARIATIQGTVLGLKEVKEMVFDLRQKAKEMAENELKEKEKS